MNINTSRFGELEINKKDMIKFVDGILGFSELRNFAVVDPGDNTLILWLQSTENPEIAFPIIEPKIFNPDYVVKLLPSELASLELENINDALIYTILTIPSDVTKMSANLKAPIIINNGKKVARQIVLQNNGLQVQYEMYKALKQYIVNYTSDDTKRTNVQEPKTEAPAAEGTAETPADRSSDKTL